MSANILTCNTGLDAMNALLNGGTVEIKSGAKPDIDSAPSGTVLVTLSLPATAFGSAANRIATANSIASVAATSAGDGSPYHYVAKDSGGTIRRDGYICVEMTLNQDTWNVGDTVTIASWTSSLPKG